MDVKEFKKKFIIGLIVAWIIPPIAGISGMSFLGFWTLEEGLFSFFHLGWALLLSTSLGTILFFNHFLIKPLKSDSLSHRALEDNVVLKYFPYIFWVMLGVYCLLGSSSMLLAQDIFANQSHTLKDYTYTMFGVLPFFLITACPLFFYLADLIGKFLGSHRIVHPITPLWLKFSVLGIGTPLMIDTILIIYYQNRTGYLTTETIGLWFSLIGVAIFGTFIAYRSFKKAIAPFNAAVINIEDLSEKLILKKMHAVSSDEIGELVLQWAKLLNERRKAQNNTKKAKKKLSVINDELHLEIQQRKHQQKILKGLVEATAATSGEEFYKNLVHSLATLLGMRYACVTQYTTASPSRVITLANWANGHLDENMEYDISNTPCDVALKGKVAFYPEKVQELFPEDQLLVDMRVESFLGVPLFNPANEVIGHLVVLDDKPMKNRDELVSIMTIFAVRAATECVQQQAKKELLKSKKEAEEANLTKSLFMSQMSHELRTPLNAILGFSQLLNTDEIDPLTTEQTEFVREILNAGEHLLELVNETLDLSKIKSGEIELNNETVNPKELIAECHKIAEILANKHHLELIHQCCGDCVVNINVDKIRFKQVLLNLISNAVKYNREKGSVIIECGVSHNCKLYRIRVKDTGIGMTAEEMIKIFEPFSRTQKTKFIEGIGIGLSTTKQLVELMGGTIGVSSEVNVGSEFWIEFPIVNKSTN